MSTAMSTRPLEFRSPAPLGGLLWWTIRSPTRCGEILRVGCLGYNVAHSFEPVERAMGGIDSEMARMYKVTEALDLPVRA